MEGIFLEIEFNKGEVGWEKRRRSNFLIIV
jgi:hypothetical protein